MTEIKLKRAYEPASPADGYRILVDRLWPRGMSHETLHYDLWDKAVSPSTQLREWFHADPEGRWPEFASRYADELRQLPAMSQLNGVMKQHPVVTLLFGSHDTVHNQAVVIREVALEMLGH